MSGFDPKITIFYLLSLIIFDREWMLMNREHGRLKKWQVSMGKLIRERLERTAFQAGQCRCMGISPSRYEISTILYKWGGVSEVLQTVKWSSSL